MSAVHCRRGRPPAVRVLLALVTACTAGAAEPPATPRFPVPVRAWFQPPSLDSRPDLYGGMNLITSLDDAEVAARWTARGVVTLKWAYGPQSEWSRGRADYYRDQCAPIVAGATFRFAGVGIDEWNPGSERFAEEAPVAAAGYRAARAMWPDNLVAAWVTEPDETFLSLLADGTFDLAIIEGYSFIPGVGGLTLDGIRDRCARVERAGLLDRCIVCFGYVAAGRDATGRRMTADDLEVLVRTVRTEYPSMPGVAFYGHDDGDPGTPALVAAANRLAEAVYPACEVTGDPSPADRSGVGPTVLERP